MVRSSLHPVNNQGMKHNFDFSGLCRGFFGKGWCRGGWRLREIGVGAGGGKQ